MKDEIKEKLLREIEDNLISENRTYDERDIKKAIEKTSKAKDEEFIKILDEIEKNNWMYADMDEAEFWVTSTITQEEANIRANHTSAIIEEIKQRIKENEE